MATNDEWFRERKRTNDLTERHLRNQEHQEFLHQISMERLEKAKIEEQRRQNEMMLQRMSEERRLRFSQWLGTPQGQEYRRWENLADQYIAQVNSFQDAFAQQQQLEAQKAMEEITAVRDMLRRDNEVKTGGIVATGIIAAIFLLFVWGTLNSGIISELPIPGFFRWVLNWCGYIAIIIWVIKICSSMISKKENKAADFAFVREGYSEAQRNGLIDSTIEKYNFYFEHGKLLTRKEFNYYVFSNQFKFNLAQPRKFYNENEVDGISQIQAIRNFMDKAPENFPHKFPYLRAPGPAVIADIPAESDLKYFLENYKNDKEIQRKLNLF